MAVSAAGSGRARGLVTLYDEDFPSFTSTDLWADLQAADARGPAPASRAVRACSPRPTSKAVPATSPSSVDARRRRGRRSSFEDTEIPWREAPARWPLLPEVPASTRARGRLARRPAFRAEPDPRALAGGAARRSSRHSAATTGSRSGPTLRGIDLAQVSRLAESLLQATADVYGHGLGIYLAQLDLPIDDVWHVRPGLGLSRAALRRRSSRARTASRPLIRTLARPGRRARGADRASTSSTARCRRARACATGSAERDPRRCCAWRRLAGLRAQSARRRAWRSTWCTPIRRCASGSAGSATRRRRSATACCWSRWCAIGPGSRRGSSTPRATTSGRSPIWPGCTACDASRRTALYEQRLWQAEPGASMAADYEEALSGATRVAASSRRSTCGCCSARRGPRCAPRPGCAPRCSPRSCGVSCGASSTRSGGAPAARRSFIKDELWRPGRRHTADELLGFMGYRRASTQPYSPRSSRRCCAHYDRTDPSRRERPRAHGRRLGQGRHAPRSDRAGRRQHAAGHRAPDRRRAAWPRATCWPWPRSPA